MYQSSPATVTEVQKLMQTVADNRFLGQVKQRENWEREGNPLS
jgi:hypothetical protein